MKKITISQSQPQAVSCNVFVGSNLLPQLSGLAEFDKHSNVIAVIDSNLPGSLHIQGISAEIRIFSGEKNKNIKSVEKIWKKLTLEKCDRKSLVVNIGGGVICDMGGFAAATYMRGIDFVQVPTTLLAMVDASVGGKVAVSFNGFKNMIGSFRQPKAVIIDTGILNTLPKREFNSGFAEIIKHGLITDKKYFQTVTAKKPQEYSDDEITEIVTGSIRIKKEIVEFDETEQGKRKLLNFGHTIGHAIESLSQKSKKPLLHGEAISIGMVAEARLSVMAGLLKSKLLEKITAVLENAGLPVALPDYPQKNVLHKILSDKKNIKGSTRWTLLTNIGEAVYDKELDQNLIKKLWK